MRMCKSQKRMGERECGWNGIGVFFGRAGGGRE